MFFAQFLIYLYSIQYFIFFFCFTGKKRCGTNIQQHSKKTNRNAIAYGRIHLHQARNSIHSRPRVIMRLVLFISSFFLSFCRSLFVFTHVLIFFYFHRYEHQEIALNCGTMLRECARYEALAKILIYSEDFYNFFKYVEVSTFDIASDAFSTFKAFWFTITIDWCLSLQLTYFYLLQELLTKHKILCAEFLEANYDKVFAHYQGLLNSENYVTRRQSLKLLGELLLDRHNFTVTSPSAPLYRVFFNDSTFPFAFHSRWWLATFPIPTTWS